MIAYSINSNVFRTSCVIYQVDQSNNAAKSDGLVYLMEVYTVLSRRRRHAVPVTLQLVHAAVKVQRVSVLQAPTEREYQHAILPFESRKTQHEEHRMGDRVYQTMV